MGEGQKILLIPFGIKKKIGYTPEEPVPGLFYSIGLVFFSARQGHAFTGIGMTGLKWSAPTQYETSFS